MANKVKFGLSNVYYAVLTETINPQTGVVTETYGTPVPIKGAVNLSLNQSGEQTAFRADNLDYFVTYSNNGYEGDLELAKIPDAFFKDVLGYGEDKNDVLYEDAGATPVHFALIFQFEGDAHAKRHVLYNCVASRPAISGQTKEDSVEPQTESISITATSIYNAALDKDVVKASCTPTESTQYNGWLTSVYQLTTT